VGDPIASALSHLASSQDASGSWKGDYGGPLFLLPIFVATARTVGFAIDEATRSGMETYLRNHQNADGGWGLHVEGASHVFTTALSYVALRFLGVAPDDRSSARALTFLAAHGGPCGSASWGKFVLAVLGLYDWDGLHAVPPEFWLLPESLPFHPSRLWCHSRMVYLPMAYLYGRRATVPEDPLLAAIRNELYAGAAWDAIDWREARDRVSATDSYVPRSTLARLALRAADVAERVAPTVLRRAALARVLAIIRTEDAATDSICLGPVNKLFNTLVWHFENPGGPELARHVARLPDYLWRAQDGVKMQGYNSSELWDTAFAVQAIVATGREGEHPETLRKAARFIEANQVISDVADRKRAYRDGSRGGWPFSTRAHGWPISDCTAEGLKAALLLAPRCGDPIPDERLRAAVALLLAMQNRDGGWATYEKTRGPAWLERLNPSDCFADIMIDPSYVECTSASVQALAAWAAHRPGARDTTVDAAIARGRDFLLAAQRVDGSWEGSWGICFTYGAWFGTWGLRAAGLPATHAAISRAAAFLLAKQLPDGGWGETPESCRKREYVDAEGGQAVMTSWALLALAAAGHGGSEASRRGLTFLANRQRADGSFPEEHIAGMFNKTCAIHYDNYLKIFPLWAMAVAGRPPGGRIPDAKFHAFAFKKDAVDYWDGE
jgi:squalene/oxidosqualene cyclase-like protein